MSCQNNYVQLHSLRRIISELLRELLNQQLMQIIISCTDEAVGCKHDGWAAGAGEGT